MYFLKRYYKTRRDMTIPLETIQEKRFKEVNNILYGNFLPHFFLHFFLSTLWII